MPTIWDEFELQKRKAFIAEMRGMYPSLFHGGEDRPSPESEIARADRLAEVYRSTPCVLRGRETTSEGSGDANE